MGSEDAEHTRFPCLATVRSLVAAVVTVLAVTAVVMVIVKIDRAEDFSLSIRRGYIQSEELWWTETETTIHPIGAAVGGRGSIPLSSAYSSDEGTIDDYGFGQIGHAPEVMTMTTYAPATKPVNLRVTWSAYNPSGRGPIECYVTAIRVFDMPNTSATGMEIGADSSLDKPLHFSVASRTLHTETQLVTISNNNTLQYIYDQYQGQNTFMAMVRVTAIRTSKATPILPAKNNSDTYSCSPVTVVHGNPDEETFFKVPCTPPDHSPAPAPAPAPADT